MPYTDSEGREYVFMESAQDKSSANAVENKFFIISAKIQNSAQNLELPVIN